MSVSLPLTFVISLTVRLVNFVWQSTIIPMGLSCCCYGDEETSSLVCFFFFDFIGGCQTKKFYLIYLSPFIEYPGCCFALCDVSGSLIKIQSTIAKCSVMFTCVQTEVVLT